MVGVVGVARRKLVGMVDRQQQMPHIGFGDRGRRNGRASWFLAKTVHSGGASQEVVVESAKQLMSVDPYLMIGPVQQCLVHCNQGISMSEAIFRSLSLTDKTSEAHIIDPDSELDISDFIIEGSSDMASSGDGPCVDRSFVSRYLYRCLGDFMQTAYEAKIYQEKPNKRKMCSLFETGFRCFESKVENDFGVVCTEHDMYDTAQWFKEEVYGDFGIDIRRCQYPVRPPPTTTQPATTTLTSGVFPVADTPKTALVAGFVLGGAVIFIGVLLALVIFKRRFQCSKAPNQTAKPVPNRASVNLSSASGSANGLNGNEKMAPPLHPQCHVNITDTRSTLTGLSSDASGHLHTPGYEHQFVRPQSSHIYTEISDDMAAMESQRVAPIGCSTIISGSAPPINSYLNCQDMVSVPCGMTVEYIQNGGYVTHAQSPGYVNFNTNHQFLMPQHAQNER
ncbi:hypothetical protein FSP39_009678 [Pinctada imbricata]|uniref:Uncharacterized protein n=1 Tax=Pinctada imbricata TaxID=66713 RepID=A0AA88Y632_PINIB|nr:hypothetical protein FSP39_009678 [Pinctada imbricata]